MGYMERVRERKRGREKRKGWLWRVKDGDNHHGGLSGKIKEKIQRGVSVYVANLPATLDKFGLKGIFSKAGRVVDTYIPRKTTTGGRSYYGFVHYGSFNVARRSIQLFNNKSVRGCKLVVCMARSQKPQSKYRVRDQPTDHQGGAIGRRQEADKSKSMRKEWRPRKRQQETESLHTIEGQLNEDFLAWLPKSLVCTSPGTRDAAALESAILNGYGQCQRIYTLSGFKFILTYQSEEERDEALRNHKELDQWFSEIKVWDRYDTCTTRTVWLEVIGVPPHGWTWENFKKIADLWGDLICLGKPIFRTQAFDNIKILIETDILAFIEVDIVLRLEELGFRVHVREVSYQGVIHGANCVSPKSREENESNNNVPGFEDLDSHIEIVQDKSSLGCDIHNRVVEEQQHYGLKGISDEKMISNSNFTKAIEESGHDFQSGQNNSDTRTKTAHFSSHECSEEVDNLVISSQLLPLRTGEVLGNTKGTGMLNEEVVAQEPPGFESRINIGSCHNTKALIEGNLGSQANSQEVSPVEPPGFELRAEAVNTKSSEQRSKRDLGSEQQTIQDNQRETNCSDHSARSGKNSCEQLAKEALRIGQLLGIRVVRHEQAAIDSIVESMGRRKGVLTRSSKKAILNQVAQQEEQ